MHNYCNGTVTVTENHTYCIQSFVTDKQGESNTKKQQHKKQTTTKKQQQNNNKEQKKKYFYLFILFLYLPVVCLQPTYTVRHAIRYEGTRSWRVL